MTLDALGHRTDGPPVPADTDGLSLADRNDFRTGAIASWSQPAAASPAAGRRILEIQLLIMVPLLGGVMAGSVLGAGIRVTTCVLAAWTVVRLRGVSTPFRTSVPDGAAFLRHVGVPFAVAGAAVAAHLLPAEKLTDGLVLALIMTALFMATALVLRAQAGPQRVLLVGEREPVTRTTTAWRKVRGVDVVATAMVGLGPDDVDPQYGDGMTAAPVVVDGVTDLGERVRQLEIDTVVVLPSRELGWPEIRAIGWAIERSGATLLVRTEVDGAARHRLAVGHVGGYGMTGVAPSRAPWHVRAAKTVLDRAVGTLLLLAVSPLLALLVLAVRLDSRGPGFFTQTRIGLGGRPFRVYKLRTMCTEAEERKVGLRDHDQGNGVLFKMRRDPRITRVGGLLRRTSLDELPQLINVVRGEMSLVGPRPALPEEVAQYDETALRRLAVRPGITGLWQVSGRSDLDWDGSVALDVRYTDNVTILEDLRICWRTLGAVSTGRGAY